MLYLAATLIVLTALAHTVLGERYIISRVLRRDLPRLFGDDRFTKGTLRFAWHITSIAWLLLAWILVLAAEAPDSEFRAQLLFAVVIASAVSALLPLYFTRGRHLSWVVFTAVALLVRAGSG